MKFAKTLTGLAQLSLVLAMPTQISGQGSLSPYASPLDRRGKSGAEADRNSPPPSPVRGKAPTPTATPAAGEGAAEGGEEEGEVEQEGQFDAPIVLPSGGKVDTLFPPGTNGIFEIEIQTDADKTLTVSKNPNPGPAPAGFVHLEPNSFIVKVDEGPAGAKLQKVDYISKAGSTIDISKGVIGRFCSEAGAFVTDAAIGKQEFELEENELLIEVADMNGEWAFFVPDPAAAGGAGEAGKAPADTVDGTAAQLAKLLVDLVSQAKGSA